jgi:hypothetical protein
MGDLEKERLILENMRTSTVNNLKLFQHQRLFRPGYDLC